MYGRLGDDGIEQRRGDAVSDRVYRRLAARKGRRTHQMVFRD
jgi:hypothetical protein